MIHTMRKLARPAAAAAALLAVVAACESDVDPPFSVEGTGAVEGLAFYDADADGVFDPSDGDTALTGIRLEVRERGTQQTLANSDVQTGPNGRFIIPALPAGTHDLFVDPATVPDELTICVNPMPVTVHLGEATFLDVEGRLGCLVLIAEAKQLADDEVVVVRGVVTAGQGTFRSDNAYIQDRSAGIQVFGVPSSLGLVPGDSVEVTGELDTFSGERELVSPSVVVLGTGTVPDPQLVTGAEILSDGDLQGLLLQVEDVEVLSVSITGGDDHNVSVRDANGDVFLIRVEQETGIPSSTWQVGQTYDVVGVLGAFSDAPQLKPRSPADVTQN